MGDFGVCLTAFSTISIIIQTPDEELSLGTMAFLRVPETCGLTTKMLWSCSGFTWWPYTLQRYFILFSPFICHPSVFVSGAGISSSRWCNGDCTYWLYSYLRVSQINERFTSVTTSLLMSYWILDCRWQPSNNSSISPPQSLTFFCSLAYLESILPFLSYLSLSVCLSSSSLSLPSCPCSHPYDVWYVSLVKTTQGRHVDIPPCLFISPRRAECCWVVLINDIDRSTHGLTYSEWEREQETESESRRERERNWEEKNNSLNLDTLFFPLQALFPWKPYHRDSQRQYRYEEKVKGGKNKNTKVWLEDFKGTSSFNYGCLLQCCSFFIYICNEQWEKMWRRDQNMWQHINGTKSRLPIIR